MPWYGKISLGKYPLKTEKPRGSVHIPPLDGSINPPVRVDTPLECVEIPLPKNIKDKTTRSFKIFEGFQGTFYKKFPEWGLGQRPK